MLAAVQSRLSAALETRRAKKARRIGFHVVRGAKKFIFGTGNAAWVVGTTMLVMVMPLAFEIEREAQLVEWENAQGGAAPQVLKVIEAAAVMERCYAQCSFSSSQTARCATSPCWTLAPGVCATSPCEGFSSY
eukprot:260039-Pleurochrysis_carterae.AAC.1